jgi:hypothetical protein
MPSIWLCTATVFTAWIVPSASRKIGTFCTLGETAVTGIGAGRRTASLACGRVCHQ